MMFGRSICFEYVSGVCVWSLCLEYLSGVSVCMDYLFGYGWLRMVTDGYYLSGKPSPSPSLSLSLLLILEKLVYAIWAHGFAHSFDRQSGSYPSGGAYKADKAFLIGSKALV